MLQLEQCPECETHMRCHDLLSTLFIIMLNNICIALDCTCHLNTNRHNQNKVPTDASLFSLCRCEGFIMCHLTMVFAFEMGEKSEYVCKCKHNYKNECDKSLQNLFADTSDQNIQCKALIFKQVADVLFK